ncbi:MAG: riboflavin biosynthesis protein RibF [Elusimicrobia bacterium]|nr:riboflavin biosynthesis protein RibF [Candidatus Liberimonas magnetica]
MRPSCVSIGTFDGVHLGHQHLIKNLLKTARKKNLKSILVTIASPVRPVPGVLTVQKEKLELLKSFSLDEIIILPNTSEILEQSALSFFENFICRKLKTKYIIAGENFAFGRNREGDIQWLKEKSKAEGIRIEIVKPYLDNGLVSSTRIRRLMLCGKLSEANKLLGREYQFEGMPVKGRGLGRKLGFPTINLKVDPEKLLPTGVYAAWAVIGAGDEKENAAAWPSVVNIGTRPTFFNKGNIHSEVHLLDVKCLCPDKRTIVALHKFIRPEKKFENIERLTKQVNLDISEAKNFFKVIS